MMREFPGLGKELGEFSGEISITFKSGAEPFAQKVPRIVPIALMDKLEKEIKRLIRLDVIEPIYIVTDWVAPIICVPKGDGVRMC